MSFSLRDCAQNFLANRDSDDTLLYDDLQYCRERYQDSLQRGDTAEYNPDNEEQPPPPNQITPDQIIGGKKTRKRRHRHRRKSRRNRRKSHKRK